MLPCLYAYAGKEKYDTYFAQHQVGTHGGIRYKMHLMSETSDKDGYHQRTARQT